MAFKTDAIQHGVYIDKTYSSVTTPIYSSSTYAFSKLGSPPPFDYSRSGNPTRHALAENLARLEGGTRASITATGMGAVTAAIFLFRPGDHIITGKDIYGGTYRLFSTIMTAMGIEFSYLNMGDADAIRAAIKPNTKGIWIETPGNPLLNITDISAVVEIAKQNEILTIADNTFMSPYFQRPLELGVDVVVESMTKYINGHSDVVAGAVVTKDGSLGERIAEIVNSMGLPSGPFDSFLVLRGVKTLPYRMEGHQANALAVAEFLESHPKVNRVNYPGLPSHPHHELAKRQMSGFGGMLSFEYKPGSLDPDAFLAKLKIFLLAESLGGVESLICQPWSMTHLSMPEPARVAAGIRPELFRLSIGLEDRDDLIRDLADALES
ncbi:MAG: PLP-dependent aspartate aminotransferase family protein [Sumerlaeia bacterium]